MTLNEIKSRLISAVTAWDRKQLSKKHHNPHALVIYIERVDEVMRDIESGTNPRAAIIRGFNDRLLDHCLRSLDMETASIEEHNSRICY